MVLTISLVLIFSSARLAEAEESIKKDVEKNGESEASLQVKVKEKHFMSFFKVHFKGF